MLLYEAVYIFNFILWLGAPDYSINKVGLQLLQIFYVIIDAEDSRIKADIRLAIHGQINGEPTAFTRPGKDADDSVVFLDQAVRYGKDQTCPVPAAARRTAGIKYIIHNLQLTAFTIIFKLHD